MMTLSINIVIILILSDVIPRTIAEPDETVTLTTPATTDSVTHTQG